MNWHYGNPIANGSYLCCIKGYSSPISLIWEKEEGGWGEWDGADWDEVESWNQFDNDLVVCYIGFDEIPMPEGW
jgi:hypothetical protein